MKYEQNDVNELYKSAGINVNSYIEIKENEAVTKIKKKWPLVGEVMSCCAQNSVIQHDKIS